MAVIEQSLAAKNSTASVSFASWTVNPGELLLVAVTMRTTTITPTVSGNGVTWTNIIDVTGGQNRLVVFRAMPTVLSTQAVTVTVTGNSKPIICFASRLSGSATGNNGANAIEATATANLNSSDMLKAITTVADNSQVVAIGTYRTKLFTVPVGQTGLIINETQGGSSDQITSSWWQDDAATSPPGSDTMGGSGDLSGSTEWILAVLSIKLPNVKSLSGIWTGAGTFTRRVGKPTQAGVVLLGANENPFTLKGLVGTMSSAGSLAKSASRSLASTLTIAGVMAIQSGRFVFATAVLFLSGTIPPRQIRKSMIKTLRLQRTLLKFVPHSPFTGGLTFSGLIHRYWPTFDTAFSYIGRTTKHLIPRARRD